jgi:UDP-glucose 4-epimerase
MDLPRIAVDPFDPQLELTLAKRAPAAVLHLGLDIDLDAPRPRAARESAATGMRALLAACASAGVERVAVLSSSCVYGALPDGSDFVDEDHPVRASADHAVLRDAIAAEALALQLAHGSAVPRVCVLRAVPALGFLKSSWLARYLCQPLAVGVLGFDPMVQVLHEDDLVQALELCVERGLRGVYNVAGAGELPLSIAIAEAGGRRVALPESLAAAVLPRASGLPRSALAYLKYPWTVSGARFTAATGFRPLFGLRETLRALR